jgi:hypothetical protein
MKRTILPDGDVQEEVTPREARQGRPGWPVLYVLVGGLILAGIAFGVLYLGSKATDTVPDRQTKGVSSLVMIERAA